MKYFSINFLSIILGVLLGLMSCHHQNHTFDIEMEKQLVVQAIHNSIGWAKNKDIDLLYSVIANDTNYIEIHPTNRIVRGFQDFKKSESFWMSDHFIAIRYEIRDLKIDFAASGNVAWFFCILDDINEWKGQPANWENTRWTGVLEKREGKWIIMQMHFSFAQS
jgi:hypothetical protein